MDRPVLDQIQWRQLWKEQTGDPERRRITKVVSKGEAMPTPDEAAIAAELAIRWARSLRVRALPGLMTGAALLVVLLATRPGVPSGSYWWWVGIAVVWLTVYPSLAWFWMLRLRRAYRSNRTLSERGSG